jgi:hypothetical protein
MHVAQGAGRTPLACRGAGTLESPAMHRINAVMPIVSGFICGYHLPDLAWKIDSGAGVHSATDLVPWIIVPAAGLYALIGAWQAFKRARPAPGSH